MSFRIGQNTAAAAGASLMDMANFLRTNEQNAVAQQERADGRNQNLIDRLARHMLEQEKMKAEANKANAEQANKASQDEAFKLFQSDIATKPQATPAERAQMALARGVTGDDRAKNYLAADLGAGRFGESQAENLRRGERFSDTMKFKTDKAQQDYDFAERKWAQAVKDAGEAQDERERHNKAMEAQRWQSIRDSKAKSIMAFSSRGGLVIDDEEEYLSAQRELEDNKTKLQAMQEEQSKALPDPMKKAEYDALLRNTSELEKEIQRVNIEGYGPAAEKGSGVVELETDGTTRTERKPRKPRKPAPAHAPSKPKAELRKATIEDF